MNIKYSIVYTLITLLWISCSEDAEERGLPRDDGYIPVTLSMTLSGISADVETRGLTDTQEKQVDELRVFIFDHASGTYMHDAAGNNINQTGSNLTCRILMYEGTYDFVVVANAAAWIENSFPGGIIPDNITYTQFARQLVAECDDIWNAGSPPDLIPMWGMVKNKNITLTNDHVTGIELLRALARINVTVENTLPGNYELQSVSVYRNYRRGRVIPEESKWNGTGVTGISLPSGGTLLNTTGRTVTNITNSGSSCSGEIYVFETPAGTDLSGGAVDENFCLVLGILYNGSTSYYRVDFAGTSGYIPVLRNHTYLLTVKDIDRPGFGSVADALAGRPANIDYEIIDTNKSGMNNIAWDGQHYLMVSSDTLRFWNSAGELTLHVQTNYAKGWTIDTGALPAWLTVQPNSSTNTTENAVKVSVIADPSLTAERETKFTVQTGALSLDVVVIQSDQTELSIDTDRDYLIFYSTAQEENVRVDRAPASTPYTVEFIGDAGMSWATFPTGPQTGTQLTFRPANNTSPNILTGIIRLTIKSVDDRVEYKDITIRQYPGNNPFAITTSSPYLSTGGDASFWILSSEPWYLRRSIPVAAATLPGTYPAIPVVAEEYAFNLTPNNTYADRQVTLVFSTTDNSTEYEEVITQEGNTPSLLFNTTLTNELDVHFTDNGPVYQDVPFQYNFAWRMTAGTGFQDVVSGMSRQTDVTYPCTDIAQGQGETLRITPYDYTNQTDVPEAATVLTSSITFFNYDTDPYPTTQMGKINLKRTIQPVIDIISITPSAGSVLPRQGGTITVTAGANAAWGISTSTGETASAPTGNYAVKTLTVTIPRNDDFGTNKQMELFYTFNGETISLGLFQQEAYNLSASIDHAGGIYGTQVVCPVTISGHYPDLRIKIVDDGGTDASAVYSLAGGTLEQQFDITLFANPKGVRRYLYLYYSPDNGNTWYNSGEWKLQYRDGFYVQTFVDSSTKGYIALTNALSQGNTGNQQMTWAEAMGIDTHYNNWTYYDTYDNNNRENSHYTTTELTGCGAYAETDYDGWRLPTSTEIKEILKAQIEGTYDFGITDNQKFHTSYDGGVKSSRLVWMENGAIKESQLTENKHEQGYVRCIYRMGSVQSPPNGVLP